MEEGRSVAAHQGRVQVTDRWTVYERDLPDGRTISVGLLIFGTARLYIGATGSYFYDDGW